MITIKELFEGLAELFPEVEIYRDVIEVPELELLKLPYAYVTTGETQSFAAENITYFRVTPVSLYWVEKDPDPEIERKTIEFLRDHDTPFTDEDSFDDEIGAYSHVYNFNTK